MLLSAGADLEARDGNGDTPLLLTIQPDHQQFGLVALGLLLSAGADAASIIDCRNSYSFIPFSCSITCTLFMSNPLKL